MFQIKQPAHPLLLYCFYCVSSSLNVCSVLGAGNILCSGRPWTLIPPVPCQKQGHRNTHFHLISRLIIRKLIFLPSKRLYYIVLNERTRMLRARLAPLFVSQPRTSTCSTVNNLIFPYICGLYGSNSKSVVKQCKKQITKHKSSQN